MAIISIIAAMDENRVIGKDNKLPWYIPEDFKWFKEKTAGKPVIMGRKTHESIGKNLPGRLNLVITRDKEYKSPYKNIYVYNSLENVMDENDALDELMVIGGTEIFSVMLPIANRMYITKIFTQFDGDTYFPKYNEKEWDIKERNMSSNKDYLFEFIIMERI